MTKEERQFMNDQSLLIGLMHGGIFGIISSISSDSDRINALKILHDEVKVKIKDLFYSDREYKITIDEKSE